MSWVRFLHNGIIRSHRGWELFLSFRKMRPSVIGNEVPHPLLEPFYIPVRILSTISSSSTLHRAKQPTLITPHAISEGAASDQSGPDQTLSWSWSWSLLSVPVPLHVSSRKKTSRPRRNGRAFRPIGLSKARKGPDHVVPPSRDNCTGRQRDSLRPCRWPGPFEWERERERES